MRITKKQSIIIALVILAIFFSVALILSGGRAGQIPSVTLQRNEKGEIEAKVVFGEFRKSEMKEGKKLWEIYAKTGRYYPESGRAELEQPVVDLFRGENTVKVTANFASVELSGATLDSVNAKGNVVIASGERQALLECEEANYSKSSDKLECPGTVTVRAPQGIIKGEYLVGTLSSKEFTIKKNVTTEVSRKK